MARENQLWNTLKQARLVLRDRLHMNRVENSASPGSPDVEGFLEGMGAFQFELKSTERPTREESPVRFDMKRREKQIEYMARRWAIGGACFWLLQVGSGAGRQIYMLEGDKGTQIRDGMNEDQLRELDLLKNPKFDAAEAVQMAFR
jgi:penicillin-binding protein-related factor A (putative recombinase)